MKKSFLLVFSALSLIPQGAYACAVCFSAKEGQIAAYLVTAIVLTLLPFAIIGGFALWYRLR